MAYAVAQIPGRIDHKRVAAIAGVLLLHIVVVAQLLLPRSPLSLPQRSAPPDDPIVFVPMQPPPPPLPPAPPVQPAPPTPVQLVLIPTPPAPEAPLEFAPPPAPSIAPSEASIEPAPAAELAPTGSTPNDALSLKTLYAPPPAYPRREQIRGIEGSVELLVKVGADGLPIEIRVARPSVHRSFEQAAMRALRRWRFQPYIVDGSARDVWARVPINFAMDER